MQLQSPAKKVAQRSHSSHIDPPSRCHDVGWQPLAPIIMSEETAAHAVFRATSCVFGGGGRKTSPLSGARVCDRMLASSEDQNVSS